jgi:hypothetical protein
MSAVAKLTTRRLRRGKRPGLYVVSFDEIISLRNA